MTRGGQKPTRDGAERKCIVTGESQAASGLIRFVVGPGDEVVADVLGKLPGRGMWVSANPDHLRAAAEGKHFSRAARQAVVVPEGLIEGVEAALLNRVTQLLAMARKAGLAVAGYEKAKGWLDTGEAALLFQASDGSARGKSKLRSPEGERTYFDVLNASELGLAFGREHVIHAALAAGGLTERIREDALRLSGVRGRDGD